MSPRTGWKLYLIGGLSIVSLVLGALVLTGVMSAENPNSVGLQYLFVGALLAAIFFALGGHKALMSRRRTTQPQTSDDGRSELVDGEVEQSTASQETGAADPDLLPRGPIIGLNGDREPSEDVPAEFLARASAEVSPVVAAPDPDAAAESEPDADVEEVAPGVSEREAGESEAGVGEDTAVDGVAPAGVEEVVSVAGEPEGASDAIAVVESEPAAVSEEDAAAEESHAMVVTDLDAADPAAVVAYSTPAVEPVAPWSIADQVVAAVRRQENQLVDRFIDEGLLSTEGPITDRDVRAMVWVAVSSIELADNLVRGVLDRSPAELTAAPQHELLLPQPDAVE